MQKFSACRKRASGSHFFSSTTMRCNSAICPAGPPNDRQPTVNQTLRASPKVGLRAAVSVEFMSRRLDGPVVPFAGGKAQPGKQSIIDDESLPQQAMVVVAGKRRQSE